MRNYEDITKDKDQLIQELEMLRQRRAEWETLENQCMEVEETLREHAHDLNERIKELNCLYGISRLVEQDISLDEIFKGTIDLVLSAMPYPKKMCARLIVDEKEYRTEQFHDNDRKLLTDIKRGSKKIGSIEVCYKRERRQKGRELFKEEEKALIQAVAERMGRIVERNRAEGALRESEAKYSTVVEKARDGIAVIQNHVFEFVNQAMTDITGYKIEELMGMNFLDIFAPQFRDLLSQRYEGRLSGEELPPVYEVNIMRKDGRIKHVEVSFGVITYNGKPADMGFIRDITERIMAEQKIRQLAYHDALTGLPNRVLFKEQFTLAQARASRHNEKLGVVMLDLDNFKDVNDTFGHTIGDQLLQVVATKLTTLVRSEDVVSRMGGDEFMILLQEVERISDAVTISQKIVEAFRYPIVFSGHDLHVTTSVGVAIYPEDGNDIDTLLKNADIAMYRVKEEGRNGYKLYSQAIIRNTSE